MTVKILEVTRGEALGVQLAGTMARKVLEVVRFGGYRPTRAQFTAMASGTARLSLALGRLIVDAVEGGAPSPSDAEIDDWIGGAAYAGVVELLGPPPARLLN